MDATDVTIKPTEPPLASRLEHAMLNMRQAPCPIHHYFAGGIYAREMTLSAGVVVTGAVHRSEHLCTISQGKLLVFTDGTVRELRAPFTFVSKPGAQRVGVALETCVWTTYHLVGDERDLDKIMLEVCGQTNTQLGGGPDNPQLKRTIEIEEDHLDFQKFLAEYELTAEEVARLSDRQEDRIPFPVEQTLLIEAASPIAGHGLFATRHIQAGEVIGLARHNGKRTPLGSTVNHSCRPNVIGQLLPEGDILVHAIKSIAPGDEITTDYRQAMNVNGSGLRPKERITS